MPFRKVSLTLLPGSYAIGRLAPDDWVPEWTRAGTFFSTTRTPEELSFVCLSDSVPPGVKCEPGWRCLKVQGPLELHESGILASLATPLGAAGIPLLALSTYDTDYVLVREASLGRAADVLREAGHRLQLPESPAPEET